MKTPTQLFSKEELRDKLQRYEAGCHNQAMRVLGHMSHEVLSIALTTDAVPEAMTDAYVLTRKAQLAAELLKRVNAQPYDDASTLWSLFDDRCWERQAREEVFILLRQRDKALACVVLKGADFVEQGVQANPDTLGEGMWRARRGEEPPARPDILRGKPAPIKPMDFDLAFSLSVYTGETKGAGSYQRRELMYRDIREQVARGTKPERMVIVVQDHDQRKLVLVERPRYMHEVRVLLEDDARTIAEAMGMALNARVVAPSDEAKGTMTWSLPGHHGKTWEMLAAMKRELARGARPQDMMVLVAGKADRQRLNDTIGAFHPELQGVKVLTAKEAEAEAKRIERTIAVDTETQVAAPKQPYIAPQLRELSWEDYRRAVQVPREAVLPERGSYPALKSLYAPLLEGAMRGRRCDAMVVDDPLFPGRLSEAEDTAVRAAWLAGGPPK